MVLAFSGGYMGHANAELSAGPPNKEMLEFLAAFHGLDDESFELLVTYAQKDSDEKPQEFEQDSSDDAHEGEKPGIEKQEEASDD